MEQYTWLIANAVGFALKRWTGYRKLIPWVVAATVFLTNIGKALGTGDATLEPASAASDSLMGLLAFSFHGWSGILVQSAKETAYALGMHTFGKNAVMQGLLPVVFGKQKAAKKK